MGTPLNNLGLVFQAGGFKADVLGCMRRRPLYSQKQTCIGAGCMSAKCQKRTSHLSS